MNIVYTNQEETHNVILEIMWPCDLARVIVYGGAEAYCLLFRVGFIINILQAIIDFAPISNGIAILRIHVSLVNVNFIRIYVLTTDAPDYTMEQRYAKVNNILKVVKENGLVIFMRAFRQIWEKCRWRDCWKV